MDLGTKLRQAFDRISNAVLLDKTELKEAVKEIQRALISADVEVNLVLNLSREIEDIGLQTPPKGLSRREFIVKETYSLLSSLLGTRKEPPVKPKRIMLVGLFGSGKTTTGGKLAAWYSHRGQSPVLIACDIHRPASFEQLEQVSNKVKAQFSGIKGSKDVNAIIGKALEENKNKQPLILDTAGRSAFDEELLSELKLAGELFQPDETILVLGADIGQLAKAQAANFKKAVNITGIIITKMDGSSKGGGALAACAEAKAPVYFIGTGEQSNDLEPFDAERFLSRIMGYGDLQALLEKASQLQEEFEPEELLEQDFNFEVFKKQLQATKKMGPLGKVAEMMGMKQKITEKDLEVTEEKMKSFETLMDSMTVQERRNPEILSKSRLERIAKGAGKTEQEARELMKQFKMMKKMFSKVQKLAGKAENLDPKQLEKLMKKFQPKKKKFRWR